MCFVWIQNVADLCRYFPYYWDLVYFSTKKGREFLKACEIVHRFSMDVIKKRRKELEEVTSCSSRWPLLLLGACVLMSKVVVVKERTNMQAYTKCTYTCS